VCNSKCGKQLEATLYVSHISLYCLSTMYAVQMNICGVVPACAGNDTAAAVCIDDTVLGLASSSVLQLHNGLLQLLYHSGQ